jgi:membrane protein implicated in regulation of membrane protease activity
MAYGWLSEPLKRLFPQVPTMQPIWLNAALVAVVALYYVWRAAVQVRGRRESVQQRAQVLRERVAYMLWVAAESIREPASHGSRG